MQPLLKLIRQIRQALGSGGANAPVETLAAEYARVAAEAAQRLDSCAVMMEKGSEYQALQLAETEPALLDVLAVLSFAEAPEWAEFCAAQRLAVVPRFDTRAVQALDRLYAKGISANHPLYKDYRSAVSSRDDAKALQIIRSVVRLNPEDANAKAELARWENKFFQLKLRDLRAAVARQEEPAILHELAELERLAPAAKLAEMPEVAQAGGLRQRVERKAAIELSENLVASLAAEREAGAWRTVGDLLARLGTLQSEHRFQLPPAAAALCATMQRYADEQRAAAGETARFEQAVASVGSVAAQVDARLRKRPPLRLSEGESLFRDFNRRWKEVEDFQRTVSDELGQSVRTTAAALRSALDRLHRQRRMKLIAIAGTAAVVIGTASWFAVQAYRAHDYAAQLAALRGAGQVEAAEKMIAHLRTAQAGLAARAALRGRIDAVETWTRDERTRQSDADTRLADLEKAAAARFAESEPTALAGQFTTAAEVIAALPASLRPSAASRLTVTRNQFESFLTTYREKLIAQADEELLRLEALAAAKLGDEQPKETITAALAQIEPPLKALEARAHSTIALLEPPEAEQARVTSLRKRCELFQGELATLRRVNEALLQATTLDAFQQALTGFKDSRLSQAGEVQYARRLLAAFPNPDEILASLLVPGDPAAWAAAKADTSGETFAPDTVLPAEIGRLLALREDIYLNDIWDVTLVDYTRKNARRDAYARGEVKVDGPREVGDGSRTTTWTGAIFDPALKTGNPAFAPLKLHSSRTAYGVGGTGEIAASRLSAVSQSLARLELNRMTDATGERFEKPLLRVFDDLVQQKDANPVFKAFMMQQLGAMLAPRPHAWGLHYCPTLKSDLARLAVLTGEAAFRSEDWLMERKRAQFSAKLTPFFAELANRNYLAEARLNREVIRAALKAGLQFGGYIDSELHARVLAQAPDDGLWALRSQGGVVARFRRPEGDAKVGEDYAVFSPIFFVPIDPAALLKNGAHKTPGPEKPKPPASPFFEP